MSKEDKLQSIYFFQLEKTVRQFRKFSQRELSKRGIDISGEQWVVLKRAYESPGVTQKEIADSTYKDPASVTRMIDLLEKKKLASRKAKVDDRRTYGISLTNEGKKFVEQVLPIAVEMRKYGLRNVSKEEREIFFAVLKKIHDNFE